MQNRYVGDVGDYAKYSLLRHLCSGTPRLSLGVLWYLFPDESHNGDGRHVAYLDQPTLAIRDVETHAMLGDLVRSGRRTVAAVEASAILTRALFFSDPVALRAAPQERVAHRNDWFARGLATLSGADVLFLDPDNGIETRSLKSSDYRAGKFVFWNEIEAAWATGASLVIYNHLNRTAPVSVQTDRLRSAFAERLKDVALLVPLLFRRGSCRHMWVISQPRHSDLLRKRIRHFLDRGWSADTDCGAMI